jgi:hypothetical protein
VAAKSAADFAFPPHGFHSLKSEEGMAIIPPHGVPFRRESGTMIDVPAIRDAPLSAPLFRPDETPPRPPRPQRGPPLLGLHPLLRPHPPSSTAPDAPTLPSEKNRPPASQPSIAPPAVVSAAHELQPTPRGLKPPSLGYSPSRMG